MGAMHEQLLAQQNEHLEFLKIEFGGWFLAQNWTIILECGEGKLTKNYRKK